MHTLLVDTDLSMAGYNPDRVPAMQKRMIETLETIPGVESAGLSDNVPMGGGPPVIFQEVCPFDQARRSWL